MSDDFDDPPVAKTRSDLMRRVRRQHSAPEMRVRRTLHRLGLRFRLHVTNLPGTPDIVLPRWRTVIFVHGCFWHRHAGCARTTTPKMRREFWAEKFRRNIERDERTIAALRRAGWRVRIVWECESFDEGRLANRLRRWFRLTPSA